MKPQKNTTMKKYSHAWIAFMAIKRLEVIATTDNETVIKGVSEDIRKEAKALVRWFKNYRDFVIQGAWYPDEVFKDMSTSHIVKYQPTEDGPYTTFSKLPTTHIAIVQQALQMRCWQLRRPLRVHFT